MSNNDPLGLGIGEDDDFLSSMGLSLAQEPDVQVVAAPKPAPPSIIELSSDEEDDVTKVALFCRQGHVFLDCEMDFD